MNKFIIIVIWDVLVGMVGYHIHHSAFWAVVDGIFSVIAPLKWLVCHQLTLSVLHDTFSFFVN